MKEKYRFIYYNIIKHSLNITILKIWWFLEYKKGTGEHANYPYKEYYDFLDKYRLRCNTKT